MFPSSSFGVCGLEFYNTTSQFQGYLGYRATDNQVFFGSSTTQKTLPVDLDGGEYATRIAGGLNITNNNGRVLASGVNNGVQLITYGSGLAVPAVLWGPDENSGLLFNMFRRPIKMTRNGIFNNSTGGFAPLAGVALEIVDDHISFESTSPTENRGIFFTTDRTTEAYLEYDGAELNLVKNSGTGSLLVRSATTLALEGNQVEIIGNTNITGNATVTGEMNAASDRRLKNNITNLQSALSSVMMLRPVSYTFKTATYPDLNLSDRKKMGLVAQEVEEVLPNVISHNLKTTNPDGDEVQMMSVNYVEMIPLLIKGMQEQQDIIASQQKQIDELRASNDHMKAQLDSVFNTGEITASKSNENSRKNPNIDKDLHPLRMRVLSFHPKQTRGLT